MALINQSDCAILLNREIASFFLSRFEGRKWPVTRWEPIPEELHWTPSSRNHQYQPGNLGGQRWIYFKEKSIFTRTIVNWLLGVCVYVWDFAFSVVAQSSVEWLTGILSLRSQVRVYETDMVCVCIRFMSQMQSLFHDPSHHDLVCTLPVYIVLPRVHTVHTTKLATLCQLAHLRTHKHKPSPVWRL